MCKFMQRYAEVCKDMQKYAKLCRSMQSYAEVCEDMQQRYAKICKSIQWAMLPQSDVLKLPTCWIDIYICIAGKPGNQISLVLQLRVMPSPSFLFCLV